MKPVKLLYFALMLILATTLPVSLSGCNSDIGEGGVVPTEANAESCRYRDNLGSTAQDFISRCRKGRINNEFPGQYNYVTLGEIQKDKSADGRKAYKLLNDGRFKK